MSDVGVVCFFSSRRRHTRWPRDWSSDVCSSDLVALSLRCSAVCMRTFGKTHGGEPALRTLVAGHLAPPSLGLRKNRAEQRCLDGYTGTLARETPPGNSG